MLTVRSGFPCDSVPSQFLWVTRASGVHRMIAGTMCVDRCLPSGILVAHLERRQFDCGLCGFLLHVASSVLLWLSRRHWIPLVAHTRSPFQVGRQVTGSASLRQHRYGFADTVRFCGRGLIVDRAISTAYNRFTRGGALVPFSVAHADRQLKCRPSLVFGCHFAHERRTLRQTGAVSPCKTCVRRCHAALFPNKNSHGSLERS